MPTKCVFKVLRIIARLNIGGPAIHTLLLTAGLDKTRFESILVAGVVGEDEGDMTYELERHGEGDVAIPHPAGAPSDDQWEFLSGTRESTHAFSVEGRYHAVGDFLLKGQYTFSHITNLSHQKGIGDNQHELTLTALYRL